MQSTVDICDGLLLVFNDKAYEICLAYWCCRSVVGMEETARSAVGLACLLLIVVNAAETAVKLSVEYPQASNYSVVELTCTDDLHGPLVGPPAVFKLNGTDITTEVFSDLEQESEMNKISFTFNQQQEGNFSCEHGESVASVELAGTYANTENVTHRIYRNTV